MDEITLYINNRWKYIYNHVWCNGREVVILVRKMRIDCFHTTAPKGNNYALN